VVDVEEVKNRKGAKYGHIGRDEILQKQCCSLDLVYCLSFRAVDEMFLVIVQAQKHNYLITFSANKQYNLAR
jgi:hypothetical protein